MYKNGSFTHIKNNNLERLYVFFLAISITRLLTVINDVAFLGDYGKPSIFNVLIDIVLYIALVFIGYRCYLASTTDSGYYFSLLVRVLYMTIIGLPVVRLSFRLIRIVLPSDYIASENIMGLNVAIMVVHVFTLAMCMMFISDLLSKKSIAILAVMMIYIFLIVIYLTYDKRIGFSLIKENVTITYVSFTYRCLIIVGYFLVGLVLRNNYIRIKNIEIE